MKADYKNWVPKGMVYAFLIATLVCAGLCVVCGAVLGGVLKIVLMIVCGIGAVGCGAYYGWCVYAYNMFSYEGKRKLSKEIVEGIAGQVTLKDGDRVLDVGCGSGALSIAVAKRNKHAMVIGCDRWGKEYASFSKKLCYDNASAEGVRNVNFRQGDATELPFADESFDVLVSNYVYHNISVKDRQAVLLESLRTLKKGGTFAIHDIFSKSKYGDMQAFMQTLKTMGYTSVRLIDTTEGLFMEKKEAKRMMLSASMLLIGEK